MKGITRIHAMAFAILVILLFLPGFFHSGIISNGDISRSHYFYMTYLRESFWQGRLPLWNPYTLLGQPFLANPSIAFWYPVTWLFLFLPIPFAFLLHFMIHIWWSMLGISVFVRVLMKRIGKTSDTLTLFFAPFIGGAIFGLCGYTMAHVYGGNYDVLAAGSWIGWVFAALFLLLDEPSGKHLVLLSIPVGFQLLAGYTSMSLYTLSGAGICTGIHWVMQSGKRYKRLLYAVIAVMLGVGIAAIQLLPNIEFSLQTIRTLLPDYAWHATGSLIPKSYLMLLLPFPLGNMELYRGDSVRYWEHAMYIGILGTLLAVSSLLLLFRKEKRSQITIFLLMIVSVLVLAAWASFGKFGKPDFYQFLWRWMPGYTMIRIPGRFVYLVDALMASLAGIGVVSIPERVRGKGRTIVLWMIGIICLAELFPYARSFIVFSDDPNKQVDQYARYYIANQLGVGERFDAEGGYAFGYDAPVAYGIRVTHGYDVTMLRNPYLFEDAVMGYEPWAYEDMDNKEIPPNHPFERFTSVRYALFPKTGEVPLKEELGQHIVGTMSTPYGERNLVRNEDILPPWYIAPRGREFAGERALYNAVVRKTLPYESVIGFIGTPPFVPGTLCTEIQKSAVQITLYKPEEVRLMINSSCSGYLTGSEVYYPGWKAEIDGNTVPIFRANLGFMAVPMPAGKHMVRFTFHSTYLPLGAAITLLSFVILGMVWRGKRTGSVFARNVIRGIFWRTLSQDKGPVSIQ